MNQDNSAPAPTPDVLGLEVSGPIKPGWNLPLPQDLPHPTYMPAVFALGIIFLLWGIVSSFIVSLVGAVLIGIALTGWLGAIRHGV